jgi:hypothetical protein
MAMGFTRDNVERVSRGYNAELGREDHFSVMVLHDGVMKLVDEVVILAPKGKSKGGGGDASKVSLSRS